MIRTNCQVKDHFPGKHIGMQKKEVANKLVSGQMIGEQWKRNREQGSVNRDQGTGNRGQ